MLQAEAAAEAAAVDHVGGDPAETPANRLAFANDAAMFLSSQARDVARCRGATALSADEEGAGQDRGRTERTLVLTPSEYSRRNLGGLNLTANRLGWNGASISHPPARCGV